MKLLFAALLVFTISMVTSADDFCKDNNVWCKYMARYGACSWNVQTIETCPRTCGKCSVHCVISNGAVRKECGYVGIGRDECFTKGCCWAPLPSGQNGAWCYESPSNKLQ
ncbi:uncharacterized protein [Clytia hemisphaerica]|uniref:ShKT domain-containing protein n=1 Tax=Clytia hemisphaerica TaxID=252671 RepID=A0A7M5V2S7_9CNID